MIVKQSFENDSNVMGAAAPANITLLSGKEHYPFPDNKRMKLYRYENQLDFLFLTNIASI